MYTIDPKLHVELNDQLTDPQHCHIETSPGRLFCHRMSDLYEPLRGQPIRFTQLAAERVAAELKQEYCIKGVKVVPV